MSELALKLIRKNKKTKDTFLDLGKCGLNYTLPNELLDCVWLERLNLGSYYYYQPKNELIKSKNNGEYNNFNGIELDILQNLTQLKYLDLFNVGIQRIDFLRLTKQLKSLDLGSNQIQDYSFLQPLTQLQSLDLGSNQIQDISFLQSLSQLQYLSLYDNKIQDISFLLNLNQLLYLDLGINQIHDIQPLLPLLKNGLEIHLAEHENNGISLYNNPITNPPIEIVKQGRKAIIEYFEGHRRPLNECKLIFVGEGGVGKTSLMRRVVHGTFDENEKTTHGINKIAWNDIRNQKDEAIRVNLWDFGGQHIQHSLHQFFFTERVIYVLVLDPRNDLKANYWLDQIEKLGCDSEIIIAYNWKQEEDKQGDFLGNFYELRKKYPKLPDPFLLSCQTGEGIEPFKNAVINNVLKNEGLKAEYLVPWFNIKQRLEKEVSVGKNYITYDIYQQWCDDEEYKDPERQKSLLKILNSIGSIVFFDKPILKELQVLNPEWLTTGAYAILVSEQNRENKGHLSWDDLIEIFREEKEVFSDKAIRIKYTENQFQFIIELMLQYDLCYRKSSSSNEFLIPSAFGEKPNKDYSFAKENAQSYRLQFESPFEMLIMHRFIARNLFKIVDKDYWQSGIYIKHPNSETYALIETNLYSQRIECWIKGDNIRGFWEMIRGDFEEILSIYHNFSYKEEVLYKKDGKEVFLPYDEMLNSLKNGVRIISYHPTYQLANIDVMAVLELFEGKYQTQITMEKERGININVNPNINVSPNFNQSNTNTNHVNIKVDLSASNELAEIKELLLELEDHDIKNEEWKNLLIKSLDEFHRLEMAEDKAAQKTSASKIERYFKKLKDIKDVITIGLLPVDVAKKTPELLKMFGLWDVLKEAFT